MTWDNFMRRGGVGLNYVICAKTMLFGGIGTQYSLNMNI